jgi:hypothetical protein
MTWNLSLVLAEFDSGRVYGVLLTRLHSGKRLQIHLQPVLNITYMRSVSSGEKILNSMRDNSLILVDHGRRVFQRYVFNLLVGTIRAVAFFLWLLFANQTKDLKK